MRLRQAGDGAMLAEFSLRLDPAAAARVRALDAALLRAAPEGLIETSPSLRSLLVVYDPLRLSARRLSALLEALAEAPGAAPPPAAAWLIPVCYAPEFGLDLDEVAARTGLSAEQVVRRHCAPTYTAVAATSESQAQAWKFTTEAPAAGWESAGFDDKSWQEGKGGFGTRETPNSKVGTEWKGTDIWLRREVTLPATIAGKS